MRRPSIGRSPHAHDHHARRGALSRPACDAPAVPLRWAAALALATLLTAAPALDAQPRGCAAAFVDWSSRCASAHDLRVRPVACPGDAVGVLAASRGDGPTLRVEIARAPHAGFRAVGRFVLSPVGDFADWSIADPALRDTFERVAACVRDAPPAPFHDASTPRDPFPKHNIPWLLALAALAAAVVGRAALRARHVAMALGSLVATATLRALTQAPAYFHQNGQGAIWVAACLDETELRFGSGFVELYGLAARATAPAAEVGVFAAQSALAATEPWCAWLVARSLGASPALSGALGVAVAMDPVLARVARSESYFNVGIALSWLATAAMVRAPELPGALVAGLLLAQVTRTHPGLWVPAAMVPLAALLREGGARERLARTARGYAVVGGVVAITSLPMLWSVVRGQMASQWMHHGVPTSGLVALGAALAATALAVQRAPRVGVPLGMLGAVAAACVSTDIFARSGSPTWIVAAYARTFAPLALACVASLGARVRHDRTVAALALATWLAFITARRPAWTALATDVLELREVWRWRTRLPPDAVVRYVARAGPYVLWLPLHGGSPRSAQVVLDGPGANLARLDRATHYYRASICETAVARDRCAALERTMRLTPVYTRSLPARPGMEKLTYTTDPVRVTLFRIEE